MSFPFPNKYHSPGNFPHLEDKFNILLPPHLIGCFDHYGDIPNILVLFNVIIKKIGQSVKTIKIAFAILKSHKEYIAQFVDQLKEKTMTLVGVVDMLEEKYQDMPEVVELKALIKAFAQENEELIKVAFKFLEQVRKIAEFFEKIMAQEGALEKIEEALTKKAMMIKKGLEFLRNSLIMLVESGIGNRSLPNNTIGSTIPKIEANVNSQITTLNIEQNDIEIQENQGQIIAEDLERNIAMIFQLLGDGSLFEFVTTSIENVVEFAGEVKEKLEVIFSKIDPEDQTLVMNAVDDLKDLVASVVKMHLQLPGMPALPKPEGPPNVQ